MEKLPYEVLTEIFQYLPHHEVIRSSLVCKKWKLAVRQSKFFSKLSLTKKPQQWLAFEDTFKESDTFPFNSISTDCVDYSYLRMERVFALCQDYEQTIRHLEVYLASEYLAPQLQWINQFTNVLHLKFIYDCGITPDMIDLSDFVPMETVQVLEVERIIQCLDLVEKLLPKLPNLKKLCVDFGCSIYFYEDCQEEAKRILAISELVEELEIRFTDENMRPDNQSSSFRGLTRIQRPNILLYSIGIRLESITMEEVKYFAQVHSGLKWLKFDPEGQITQNTLQDITKCFPNLEYLALDNVLSWDVEYFLQDLTKLANLKTLRLEISQIRIFLPGESLNFLPKVSHMPKLKKFKLYWHWTEDAGIDLDSFEIALKSFVNLSILSLNFAGMEDIHVQLILEHLSRLKTLSLYSCSNVTDEGFLGGAKKLNDLSGLENLTIFNGVLITDRTIEESFHLKTLRKLYLAEFPEITNCGIELIVSQCPFIEDLTLKWFVDVTTFTIEVIVQNLKYLKKFHISKFEGETTSIADCIQKRIGKSPRVLKHSSKDLIFS